MLCTVMADDGTKKECRVKGSFRIKNIKTTNPIAVGDFVEFKFDQKENTGIIEKIEPRKNYIIRKSINLSKQSHIIAANVDMAFLLITLKQPRTSYGFIDRFLITAEAYHIPTSLVFNKMDIYNEKEIKEVDEMILLYQKIGYPSYKISATKKNISELKQDMENKTSLLSGHSGVGKSTLANALNPALNIKTNEISKAHHKGTHTTTFAEMLEIGNNGFLIDTPGIKELGIVDMKKEEVAHYFPEMRARMHQCKFNNCLHLNEPKCAIIAAVEKGEIAVSRYNSYLSIMNGEEMTVEYE